MALPTLARTYQYTQDTTTVQGSANANAKVTMLNLKNRLISFAQSPLTVLSSGNGVTASAADNWSTVSDIVSGGSSFSWFRFGMSEIHPNYQLVITARNNSGATFVQSGMEIIVSPTAGFTGGTASARPTATDEIIVASQGAWVAGTDVQHQLYIQRSTDGYGLRFFVFSNSLCTCLAVIDKPISSDPAWTNPSAAFCLKSSSANVPTVANLNTTASVFGRGNSGVTMPMYCSFPQHNSGSLMSRITAPFSYTSSYPMPKIRLVSETTANLGDMGVFDDIWWAPTTTATGDTFPNDTTRQFVQLGAVILPHSGSVVTMT